MIDAILVVSFGTSHEEAHKLAIRPLVDRVRAQFPEAEVAEAYSSSIIRRVLAQRGQTILSPLEALEQLKTKGYRHVVIVPTHLITGEEHAKVLRDVESMKLDFESVLCSDPLLSNHTDMLRLVEALAQAYPLQDKQALVLMGHGSPTASNAVYAALDYTFKQQGYSNIFVGANGAYPDIPEVIEQLRKDNYEHIVLAPLLLVAGEHAKEDMAGAHPESWQQQLQAAGYDVEACIQGLGEMQAVQQIYLSHVQSVVDNSAAEEEHHHA